MLFGNNASRRVHDTWKQTERRHFNVARVISCGRGGGDDDGERNRRERFDSFPVQIFVHARSYRVSPFSRSDETDRFARNPLGFA